MVYHQLVQALQKLQEENKQDSQDRLHSSFYPSKPRDIVHATSSFSEILFNGNESPDPISLHKQIPVSPFLLR